MRAVSLESTFCQYPSERFDETFAGFVLFNLPRCFIETSRVQSCTAKVPVVPSFNRKAANSKKAPEINSRPRICYTNLKPENNELGGNTHAVWVNTPTLPPTDPIYNCCQFLRRSTSASRPRAHASTERSFQSERFTASGRGGAARSALDSKRSPCL